MNSRPRRPVTLSLMAAVVLATGCTGRTEPPDPTAPPALGPSTASTASSAAASSRPTATGPSSTPISTGPAVAMRVVPLPAGVSDEASGIAASSTPGRFFLVDDGGGTGALAVVDGQGTLVTRVILIGMSASNAEALTVGSCGPVPLPDGSPTGRCLYVGDIGDNREQRGDIVVYRSAEPDLSTYEPDLESDRSTAADEWHYAYPDGPHNAESMLVLPDGALLVVTKPKNNAPHRMYRGDPGGGALTFVREFPIPGSERPMRTILTGNVATDLAATPGRVLLLTYDDLHEYTAPDPAADLTGFPDWPVRSLPFPPLPQAEGVAGAAGGCGYVVASEAGPSGSAGSLGIATCG